MSRRVEALGDVPQARSIAWPIFALVIASVVLGTLIVFAVTFSGPPPRDLPGAERAAVEMLRTGAAPAGEAPAMTFRTAAAPPALREPFHADPLARARLAASLGVRRDAVRVYTMRPGLSSEGFGRDFVLGWQIGGKWRIVETPRPWLAPWHLQTLSAILLVVLLFAGLGWLSAQAISRPVRQIASAAREARAGIPLPALPVGGPREVQDLSRAVATMHARLAAHAEGRTTMLAAIAHDLGTPLSRLSFRIEQLPEASREKAEADIVEMREMIAAALSFARDEHADLSTRVELGSLLDSLVEDMRDGGAAVTLATGPRAVVRGDPGSLRRLFANLLENAIRYGDRAKLEWRTVGNLVEVVIDDHGPGIDPPTVERLFEPFVRGDPSRNRSTGGTGLGLAIVRSIATRHRGEAVLENGPHGARARVTLPLA